MHRAAKLGVRIGFANRETPIPGFSPDLRRGQPPQHHHHAKRPAAECRGFGAPARHLVTRIPLLPGTATAFVQRVKPVSLLALVLFLLPAHGITVNEPPDHSQTPPGTAYTLETGTNTFNGSVITGGSDQQDNFQVTIPAGMRLTAVTKTTTGGSFNGFVTFNLNESLSGLGTASFGTASGLPLEAGTYPVTIAANFSTGTNWTIVFTVENLPQPPAIIGVEQFDYPDGPILGRNGGTFWDWKNTAPTARTGTPSNWDVAYGTPVVT